MKSLFSSPQEFRLVREKIIENHQAIISVYESYVLKYNHRAKSRSIEAKALLAKVKAKHGYEICKVQQHLHSLKNELKDITGPSQ